MKAVVLFEASVVVTSRTGWGSEAMTYEVWGINASCKIWASGQRTYNVT